jgi:hypothetical protein
MWQGLVVSCIEQFEKYYILKMWHVIEAVKKIFPLK